MPESNITFKNVLLNAKNATKKRKNATFSQQNNVKFFKKFTEHRIFLHGLCLHVFPSLGEP